MESQDSGFKGPSEPHADQRADALLPRKFLWLSVVWLFLASILGATGPAFGRDPISELSKCADLATAASEDSVDLRLWGTGDSTEMHLRVRNKLSVSLELCIEIGTKLEPSEADVQTMVVTREVKITLKPKAEDEVKLEVACLDISKAPPADTNNSWSVETSKKLVEFLNCANGIIDDWKDQDPSNSAKYEDLRPIIIQFSLWKARGASQKQWIDFWVEYHGATSQQAQELVQLFDPILTLVTNKCGSLKQL